MPTPNELDELAAAIKALAPLKSLLIKAEREFAARKVLEAAEIERAKANQQTIETTK